MEAVSARPGLGRRLLDAVDERLGLRALSYPVPAHANKLAYSLGRFGFWFSPGFGGVRLLHRIYTVHIAILPALFFLVVGAHPLLVKRHGMAPRPSAADRSRSRPSRSHGTSRVWATRRPGGARADRVRGADAGGAHIEG